jgi:hypothetical protein
MPSPVMYSPAVLFVCNVVPENRRRVTGVGFGDE